MIEHVQIVHIYETRHFLFKTTSMYIFIMVKTINIKCKDLKSQQSVSTKNGSSGDYVKHNKNNKKQK